METNEKKLTDEEKKTPKFTITPRNVRDLTATLTYLFNPMNSSSPVIEFSPRTDECGIEARIHSVITCFHINLSSEQVQLMLKQACEGVESWASSIRTDLMRMTTEDGSDPRVVKPEDYERE